MPGIVAQACNLSPGWVRLVSGLPDKRTYPNWRALGQYLESDSWGWPLTSTYTHRYTQPTTHPHPPTHTTNRKVSFHNWIIHVCMCIPDPYINYVLLWTPHMKHCYIKQINFIHILLTHTHTGEEFLSTLALKGNQYSLYHSIALQKRKPVTRIRETEVTSRDSFLQKDPLG